MGLSFVGIDSTQRSCVIGAGDQTQFNATQFDAVHLDWYLANARGLRQGCGELCARISHRRPDFFAITEAHLQDDPIAMLIPGGYKCMARLDRSRHGGGLLICGKDIYIWLIRWICPDSTYQM